MARTLLEPVAQQGESKFARALGSHDFHTREEGLRALTTWLSRRTDISEMDMLKLWKGIFYCYWHSDKHHVQAALADRLSEIMFQLPEQTAQLYYKTFLRTMRREWASIDRLRLDKFMMLVRKFLASVFRSLQGAGWDAAPVSDFSSFLLGEVLLPGDTLVAAGVAYHLCDILLPELEAVGGEGGAAAPTPAALRALLDPFCAALAGAREQALVHRLRQGVFDALAEALERPDRGGGVLRALDAPALASHLFGLGAEADTRVKNREALYAISKSIEQAERRRAKAEAQAAAAKPAKKSKKQAAVTAAPAAAAATPAAAAAPAPQEVQRPGSAEQGGKKGKTGKRKSEAAAEEAAAVLAPAAQAPPAAAKGVSSSKKKAKLANGAAANTPAAPAAKAAPSAAARPGWSDAGPSGTLAGVESPGRKNVRFSMRRNLVNLIGQPPAPADVRTPPKSRPKGSALKPVSSFGAREAVRSVTRRMAQGSGSGAAAGTGAAPHTAPSGKQAGKAAGKKRHSGGNEGRVLPSPHSVPRAKAASFF